ncbi:MAG: J domain-containing protein [Lachnospiraceae bacterium]|nr:J domain-containing protein [Lachnospiraceae bacterium]
MTRNRALEILGAEPDAGLRDLKKNYRDLMRKTHPDSAREHDYPYEAHEINEAYNCLLSHLYDDDGPDDGQSSPKIRWDAPVNANAYCTRPIYQYAEDANGSVIGTMTVDDGKYMWMEDEDFPLFLKSLYDTARSVISDDDAAKDISRSDDDDLLKDITYLIAGQFFGSDSALGLMRPEADGSYHSRVMVELSGPPPQEGEALFPLRLADHRLYVRDGSGNELGYMTFCDDRLLFGIIPLFERNAVKVRITAGKTKRRSADADLWIIPTHEDNVTVIESINENIRRRLDR